MRQTVKIAVERLLDGRSVKSVLMVGLRGVGKTVLLQQMRRDAEARLALQQPACDEGAAFEEAALQAIIAQTQGYPYFLQEWGKHSWDWAPQTPITEDDVQAATGSVIAALDEGFFRVRFDRLTPSEKKYLRAMADLGPGPHRSGDIASRMGRAVSSLGPARQSLIDKGMVWSPAHGDTAFTVPLFDQFMQRIIPNMNDA